MYLTHDNTSLYFEAFQPSSSTKNTENIPNTNTINVEPLKNAQHNKTENVAGCSRVFKYIFILAFHICTTLSRNKNF